MTRKTLEDEVALGHDGEMQFLDTEKTVAKQTRTSVVRAILPYFMLPVVYLIIISFDAVRQLHLMPIAFIALLLLVPVVVGGIAYLLDRFTTGEGAPKKRKRRMPS